MSSGLAPGFPHPPTPTRRVPRHCNRRIDSTLVVESLPARVSVRKKRLANSREIAIGPAAARSLPRPRIGRVRNCSFLRKLQYTNPRVSSRLPVERPCWTTARSRRSGKRIAQRTGNVSIWCAPLTNNVYAAGASIVCQIGLPSKQAIPALASL